MPTSSEDESADVPEKLGQIVDDDADQAAGRPVRSNRIGGPRADDDDESIAPDDAAGEDADGRQI